MITIETDRHGAGAAETEVHRVQAPGLCLAFQWTIDRWGHFLELGALPHPSRAAETVEADPLQEDPLRVVSPAYQQIQFQQDPQGVYALLVGQAGAHHFSASFRVTAVEEEVSIEVDVADRAHGKDAVLACSYLVHLPCSSLVDASPAAIVWEPRGRNEGRMSVSSRGLVEHPTELALVEAGHRAAYVQALAPTVSGAATQRCRFCWKWVSPQAQRT
jgi:hypothetical protein